MSGQALHEWRSGDIAPVAEPRKPMKALFGASFRTGDRQAGKSHRASAERLLDDPQLQVLSGYASVRYFLVVLPC